MYNRVNLEYEPKLSNKKIIFVLGSMELGGAERQALIFARYLISKYGIKVEFWGFSNPGRMAALCDENGIPWRIYPYPWSSSPIKRIVKLLGFARALKKENPDIIFPYTMSPNVICGLIWRYTGAKTCIWNQRDEGRERFERKYEQRAVHNIPYFISNSCHGKDFLVDKLGAEPNKIQVVKNGVELNFKVRPESFNREKWCDQLGLGENYFVACMVANLTEFKDHDTLLKAWRIVCDQLNKKNTTGLLLLAGRFDDTYRSLKVLADNLNLNDNVKFLGKVNDIHGLLSVVDLGVFSSQFEGCPNGVLECMGAGLPIVGTDIPGIREAVGSNGYQFLAPIKDPITFAEQVLKFCFDPELRAKYGTLNRHRIKTEFSPEEMCKKTFELLIENLEVT